jgi:hypothetical protein
MRGTVKKELISSRNMDREINAVVVSLDRPTMGEPLMRSQPLMRLQPLMRTRSVGQTREDTMVRPVVSCDSIHTWAKSNSNASTNKQILTPNVETVWSLNQRLRTENKPMRSSCPRNKSFNDAFGPFRHQISAATTETEEKQELLRQPPNVIVFINSGVSRQRRRSSFCSQITMDEAINYIEGGEDENEDDHSNASLDIQDVFTEAKTYKKTNDDSSTSYSGSSSNYSTAMLSSRNESLKLQKSKRLPVKTIMRKKSARHIRLQAKVQRRGSTNSAKQRWMQTGKDDETMKSNDDSYNMSDSEYEDYAQDSLGHNSRHNILRRPTEVKLKGDDITNDANNCSIKNTTQHSCSTALDHRSNMSNGMDVTSSTNNVKCMYGRAA